MLDTIVALATPRGAGGIGVVRVSGSLAGEICGAIIRCLPQPRRAWYGPFYDAGGSVFDYGLVLYFPQPRSFTGEDIIEFHGHGGLVIMDTLLERCMQLGARMALPGEFSKRAYLNGKLDLTQAEAIADLISSGTREAARLSLRTLEGSMSEKINSLSAEFKNLRVMLEASINFPEDEIDFKQDIQYELRLHKLHQELRNLIKGARIGCIYREGLYLVIAGKPNVGKSSLMNYLTGKDISIVHDIPGTARDVLRETANISGIATTLVDTAGLRTEADFVEQEGIRRALMELRKADHVFWLTDDDNHDECLADIRDMVPEDLSYTLVRNKIDLGTLTQEPAQSEYGTILCISTKTGAGMDLLINHIKQIAGGNLGQEAEFIARKRHLEALRRAESFLTSAIETLTQTQNIELLAEELRLGHNCVGEITGTCTSDDILEDIFSEFCIGK